MENQDQAQQDTAAQETAQSTGEATSNVATLSTELGGILGVKAGMTQVFTGAGSMVAVTVIDLRPNVVTQIKTPAKEHYSAVQVGMLEKKEKHATRAERGHAKKAGKKGFYYYEEFRFKNSKGVEGLTVGQVLSAGFLKEGDMIDLTSVSKGKGFQGVMKKYHYAGGPGAHGASVCHRQIGSIGNRADPGKVFKGKKMAGQMGNVRVTIQNVKVVKVDLENQILLVNGSVPGPKSAIVTIRKSVKKAG